ncbi:hypothetical protein [Nitratidesulfovibrio sp. 1201_IL3209]|uniref:hypothetical protein n=1 Tax=Nitratidesulfovibrio sp. 1201_IL3209 TaxID=3084053 RepID=UPI002FDB5237
MCRCLLTALLCVLLAACAPSGSGPSGNSGLAGDGGDAAVTAVRPGPADATTTPPANPATQRDGLPSGLPFASAGEPRVHMPAPAAPQPAPRTSEATPAPRSLADFALMTQDGQNGPGNATAQGGSADASASAFANAFDRPVLRILYNASTKGTLHPCPS